MNVPCFFRNLSRKQRWPVGTLLLAVAAVSVLAWVRLWSEPAYRGRPMSVWIRYYPEFKHESWREAEAALRFFGTNAIPVIMHEFAAPNKPIFAALREKAHANGPEWLNKLLNSSKMRIHPGFAPEVFGAIGPSSVPVLVGYLQDEHPEVHISAARGLGWFGRSAKTAIPELLEYLGNAETNSRVGYAIQQAIADIDPGALETVGTEEGGSGHQRRSRRLLVQPPP